LQESSEKPVDIWELMIINIINIKNGSTAAIC
jgi:hypothetical protein